MDFSKFEWYVRNVTKEIRLLQVTLVEIRHLKNNLLLLLLLLY